MNRIIHICPLLILACFCFNTRAQYFVAGGVAFNVLSATEQTVEVAYKHYQGNIAIPASVTYNGTIYDVVALGESAFYGGTLASVTIPSSVTQIKSQCFLFASGPSSITIPASVTNIEDLAFAAHNMININVAADNPNYVSVDGILFSKDTSTIIECPMGKNGTITLPQSTRHIATAAFAYCQALTGVTIPDGMLSIGEDAFIYNNHLNNMVIPASVSYIGANLFAGCSVLNNLSIEEGNTRYYMDGTAIYSIGGDTLVSYHKSTDSVFLPNTLRVVSGFNGNTNIKYVHIPEGVTTIGENAFGNSTLMSADLPSQMQLIDEWAFYNCTSLTHISIPASLNTMGEGAFEECSNLSTINIPNGLRVVRREAFYGCENLSQITWGDSVAIIDSFAFGGCAFTELQLPPLLRVIRSGAFNGYYDGTIRHVAFSAPIDTIEAEAFYGQPVGTMVLKNNVPPVATTYDGAYGPLENTDIASIIIPCGSLSAWLADNYWGQFADLYVEDCNSINGTNPDRIKITLQGNHISICGAASESVHVFDAAGRQIYYLASASDVETIGITHAGVYIVKVGNNQAKKVVAIK